MFSVVMATVHIYMTRYDAFFNQFRFFNRFLLSYVLDQLVVNNSDASQHNKWRMHTSPTRCVVSLRRPPHLTHPDADRDRYWRDTT